MEDRLPNGLSYWTGRILKLSSKIIIRPAHGYKMRPDERDLMLEDALKKFKSYGYSVAPTSPLGANETGICLISSNFPKASDFEKMFPIVAKNDINTGVTLFIMNPFGYLETNDSRLDFYWSLKDGFVNLKKIDSVLYNNY